MPQLNTKSCGAGTFVDMPTICSMFAGWEGSWRMPPLDEFIGRLRNQAKLPTPRGGHGTGFIGAGPPGRVLGRALERTRAQEVNFHSECKKLRK